MTASEFLEKNNKGAISQAKQKLTNINKRTKSMRILNNKKNIKVD
jgi:hypothetical protein